MDEKYQRIRQYFKNKANLNASKGDLKSFQISNNKINFNKRDYDKEPLIIKSYERFFVGYLHFISIWLAIFTTTIIYSFLFWENQPLNIIIILICYHIILFSVGGVYVYYRDIVKNNDQIHFNQNFIRFYENDEPKSSVDNMLIKHIISKPLWCYYFPRTNNIWNKIFHIVLCLLLFAISLKFSVITIFLLYVYMIIFKAITQIIFGKNLRDFKFFNTICVAEPIVPKGYITDGKILAQRYYLIYYFDKKTYDEIKTYFLDRKRIDIDKIRKDYFILF